VNELIVLAAAGYGALIGSFLNVCIFRLPRRCLRLWKPKLSFCPACARTIPWHENVPMISFLALRGRCKGCRAAIPLRYFLVEVATTAFFVFVAATHLTGEERRWGLALLHVAIFSVLLVALLIYWDTRWRGGVVKKA
jgi:leader peptidase (prepilin peptidase) / N-methyltransferase